MNRDLALFHEAVAGTRQIKRDTISPPKGRSSRKRCCAKFAKPLGVSHHFSDEFVPHLSDDGPMRYVRSDVSSFEVKRLRRGDYYPDMLLDLRPLPATSQAGNCRPARGLSSPTDPLRLCHARPRQECSQAEGAALVGPAPLVEAFHQAPREWGGDAALLVLIEQSDAAAASFKR